MAAASSSSGAIRITDGDSPEEGRMSTVPWVSLGVDDDAAAVAVHHTAADEPDDALLARARRCDVYIGHGGGGGVRRLVSWLLAELELLGVPCFAADHHRRTGVDDACARRAAMDAALAGVVVVTPATLANPYAAAEEIRAFLDVRVGGKILVPVFVGVRRRDFAAVIADDVVEGLAGVVEHAGVEVRLGDLRRRVLDVVQIVGARLGRPAVAAAVRSWRAAADAETEIPFPWNTAGFVGRERELLDVEAILRGGATTAAAPPPPARDDDKAAGKRPMSDPHGSSTSFTGTTFLHGVVCVSAGSGAGKTELVVEFAHRHAHEYKKVLWVHGEARYLRQSYLKLADHLGITVGDNVFFQTTPPTTTRSLHEIEGDAIAKIRKELSRDIPYLVVIDNLESERDNWWDGRAIQDLLPLSGTGRTHVIITTRLAGLRGVRVLELGNLDGASAMKLIKGTRTFSRNEDVAVLRDIQEQVGGVALGLSLAGKVLSELAAVVSPAQLREAMRGATTWSPEDDDDDEVRDNPGLVNLLDACFTLLHRRARVGGKVVERMLEASSFFAPAPIPAATLVRAAASSSLSSSSSGKKTSWKHLAHELRLCCTSPDRGGAAEAEHNALGMLVRLGIARRSTRAGCVSVHAVFRAFGRKTGSSSGGRVVARAVVDAIAAATQQHGDDHAWAACLSVFRFGGAPRDVSTELLPPAELARFVMRVVVPLAAGCVARYSAYAAALELLREATVAVVEAEDRYVGRSAVETILDPSRVHRRLAGARAELLVMRARIMLRAGECGVAEDHCLSAIDILEVACGECHPDTLVVRAFLEQAVRV